MEINLQFNKIKDSYRLFNFHKDMYSSKILADGIKFLSIEDANEIFDIIKSNKINRDYLAQVVDENKKRAEFVNRFAIPKGLTKKEYNIILKETQQRIDDLLEREREVGPDHSTLLSLEREDYIQKKLKIKKIMELHEEFGAGNIEKAKSYPIEQLLEFQGGFTKCIFHDEKHSSLRLYKERNRVHCFGACGQGYDALDIYQKINNVSLKEAIKSLS